MIGKVTKSSIALTVLMLALNVGVFASNDPQRPCDQSISDLLTEIIRTSKSFCGTPYRYGGTSRRGVDCSGLLRTVFGEHNLELPHSSTRLKKMGIHVDLDELKPGDLLFFKGRNVNSKSTGHVALVTSVCNGDVEMVHATRRGVVVDQLDKQPYYTKRLLEARRVIDYRQLEDLALLLEAGMFHLPRM
jgi:cell wall-associated NlpC family hydrolase